jgi:Tol biopolymer transport system component
VLPEFPHPQCCGSWTPDGKSYVFQVRVENTFQIWARREKSGLPFQTAGRPVTLVSGAVNYRGPLIGQSGRKLFMRAESPKGQLVRYDARSGQFLTLAPSISARTAAFSRDGKWMAYTSVTDNNLWRCTAEGTGCLQLTHGMQQTALPHWSPDGRTLAFMGRRFGGNWGVFTVTASGEHLQSFSPEHRSDGDPDWSADGQRLIFGNVLEAAEAKALYLLDLRTGNISALPGSKGYYSPRWSPDGGLIVALHADDQRLAVYDLGTRQWRPLSQIPGSYPSWSHDGRYVYFVSNAEGGRSVFRVDLRDSRTEKVVSLVSIERAPIVMGDWVGLAPDDSPMAVRNLTSEDIYAWDFGSK